MDPTLAPGYVHPNKGKNKHGKGHHWAEVQKSRQRARMDGSEVDSNGDSSSSSTPTTPTPPATLPTAALCERLTAARHPRISSWAGARSTLSDNEGIGGPADLEEVPVGVKRQALRLEDYSFPTHRLQTVMEGVIFLHNYN